MPIARTARYISSICEETEQEMFECDIIMLCIHVPQTGFLQVSTTIALIEI